MSAYYNDVDPYVCEWLRRLIAAGLLPAGDVDERSVSDVRPDDLQDYVQCHFFAGIGGWPYALRLAGWPDDRPVWTGSCPCQPGSVAGRQGGFDDERHLWPIWRELITQRRPSTIFGEQVAAWSNWLALVRGDLEKLEYAVGAMPIEAASAGGFQLRDRYFFVARSDDAERWTAQSTGNEPSGKTAERHESDGNTAKRRVGGMVGAPGFGWGEGWTEHELRGRGIAASVAGLGDRQIVECPDGKWRPFPPPRVRWVGNAIPARVDKLRALGNAIDPYAAAQFVSACLSAVRSP